MDSTPPNTPPPDTAAPRVQAGLKALARLLARQAAREALSADRTTRCEAQDGEPRTKQTTE